MRMYHERHGQGPPLLLLHGFSGASSDWASFVDRWSADYELIVPDLRGHGRSTNPARQYTHRQAARDLLALLDRLGIASCKAIGVSGGGNALLHMATREPARVAAMVLVSAASYYSAAARDFMRQYLVEERTDEAWRIMRQRHHRGDAQIREIWAQAGGFKDSYEDMTFTPPQLATIAAETLIVSGDRDPLVPAALALEMHAAIPRSYLWIVPNAGHGPIAGELKERFVETATAFLRGDWRR
ncbi:MAG TPA: alpha/beta hydrolase [Thermoanaerobaculia bacterium]|nr:alpha/beta hydrolase [Thermoanaerobaculia bacterium]